MTSDRKLAIFRTELRRLAAEKRRRRNPSVLGVFEHIAYEADDLFYGRPGWYVANTESGAHVAGPFRTEAEARRHLASLEGRRGWLSRRNPSHSYGCSCFGCR